MKPSTKPPKPEFDTLQESDKIANAGMPDELAKAIVVALQNAQANLVATESMEVVIARIMAKIDNSESKNDKATAKMLADAEKRWQKERAADARRRREERAADARRRREDERRHREEMAAADKRHREDQRRHREEMAAADKRHREDQRRRDEESARFHRNFSWFLGIIGTVLGIIGAVVAVLGILNIFN